MFSLMRWKYITKIFNDLIDCVFGALAQKLWMDFCRRQNLCGLFLLPNHTLWWKQMLTTEIPALFELTLAEKSFSIFTSGKQGIWWLHWVT